ncbi:MAG: uracil-DNA glycosylase family protein [Burkholderiales bacterium]
MAEFIKDIELLLGNANVLSRSGSVLYSASHTLTKGDVYILGLNPGGIDGPSISEDLAALPNKTQNSYLDESWGNRIDADGQAPLQRRIKGLVDAIGVDLRNICASNLIFMQSQNAKGIEYPKDADICWPIHEKILDIVQPKLIIAFGNSSISPYDYLFHKFNMDGHENIIESGHGSWKCRGFGAVIANRKSYVAGLPHLSRYSPFNKDGAIKENLITWLNGTHGSL